MAATTTMVHVRVNEKVKARAEKALRAMGLTVSDAVRVLLTRVAAEQALPFEVKVPNAKTRAAMAEARRGGLKRFASVGDLMAGPPAHLPEVEPGGPPTRPPRIA